MNKIAKQYDEWAGQYDSNDNPTRDLDQHVTAQTLAQFSFNNVLELGCGTGKNSAWLLTKAQQLVGLDFSESMLAIARDKIKSTSAEFKFADLNETWPVEDEAFDLVTINLTLEHIADLDHVFESAFVKLKPTGKCFVCELHPKKQLTGSKARFMDDGVESVLDVFLHLEQDYVCSAEKAGFLLVQKKDWYDKNDELPRLISLLFEKE